MVQSSGLHRQSKRRQKRVSTPHNHPPDKCRLIRGWDDLFNKVWSRTPLPTTEGGHPDTALNDEDSPTDLLSKVWEQIDQLKETTWLSVQPRKVGQHLDKALNALARVRSPPSHPSQPASQPSSPATPASQPAQQPSPASQQPSQPSQPSQLAAQPPQPGQSNRNMTSTGQNWRCRKQRQRCKAKVHQKLCAPKVPPLLLLHRQEEAAGPAHGETTPPPLPNIGLHLLRPLSRLSPAAQPQPSSTAQQPSLSPAAQPQPSLSPAAQPQPSTAQQPSSPASAQQPSLSPAAQPSTAQHSTSKLYPYPQHSTAQPSTAQHSTDFNGEIQEEEEEEYRPYISWILPTFIAQHSPAQHSTAQPSTAQHSPASAQQPSQAQHSPPASQAQHSPPASQAQHSILGYQYTHHGRSQNWRCRENQKLGCNARVLEHPKRVFCHLGEHKHPPKTNQTDYFKEYSSQVSKTYRYQVQKTLQNEYRRISVNDLRIILPFYNFHYAPAKKFIQENILAKLPDAQVNSPQPRVNKRRSLETQNAHCDEVQVSLEDERGPHHTRSFTVRLLKHVRRVKGTLDEKNLCKELKEEIAFVAERTRQQKEEADHLLALRLNEEQYEAAGQMIECGCCYGEVTFEDMVQCYDGHLFCVDCLKNYTKEKVFGSGQVSWRRPFLRTC
ncbi:uncharacterized protein LOC144927559 isoform X2 [Branchiostoma floridae x Branchiostoma belcheri]